MIAPRRASLAAPGRRARPRLLWVTHLLPWPSTGHGALQRTHHLIRQLAEVYDIHLFALSNGAGDVTDLRSMGIRDATLAKAPGLLRKAEALGASWVTRSGYWHGLFLDGALRRSIARAATPRSNLLLDTIYLSQYLANLPQTNLILNHHNVESHLLAERAKGQSPLARRFYHHQSRHTLAVERDVATQARLNLVVSDLEVERLHAVAPSARTLVVPNGVDVGYFKRRQKPVVPYSLVYAGGMDWFPNRDGVQWLVTELWPRLVAVEPRRTLTIIGKCPPRSAVALARRDSRVTVTGFVPDVRPHLEQAAAYICPIRVGGGTRLKVLDCLAMQVPMVGTGFSVEGLGMEPEIHYLRGDTVTQIADGLRRLDSDQLLGERLSRAGRRLVVERFSWDRIGASLIAGLESNLASPSR